MALHSLRWLQQRRDDGGFVGLKFLFGHRHLFVQGINSQKMSQIRERWQIPTHSYNASPLQSKHYQSLSVDLDESFDTGVEISIP